MKTKEIAVVLYPTNHKTRPILLIINYNLLYQVLHTCKINPFML